ncbi:FlgD_ig domain-containing protein [Pseudomonas sp. IT-347P]|uniref:hypothetical protein n=1 Tax=Pseudomonas sp. IT-347P TaxID=3026458 RepID=UPI0039E03EE6
MKSIETLSAEGKPDLNFGDQGVVSFPRPEISAMTPDAVLELTDNKLLVAMVELGVGGNLVLMRLNEDGALDNSFGERKLGFVEVKFDDGFQVTVSGLTALVDGGWLVFGLYMVFVGDDISETGLFVVRQSADGKLDESFAERGILLINRRDIGYPNDKSVTLGSPSQLDSRNHRSASLGANTFAAEQADGKIFLLTRVSVGGRQARSLVLSFNADGSKNSSFNGGSARVELPGVTHGSNSGGAIALQTDGKVLVGGSYSDDSLNVLGAYVTRLGPDGQVDAGFNNGIAVTIPHAGYIQVHDLKIRSEDGAIVGIGEGARGVRSGLIFMLNPSGSFNRVFNGGNPLFSLLVPHGLGWGSCTFQEDGSIVVLGNTGNGLLTEELRTITARYLATGELDTKYGNGQGYVIFEDEYWCNSAYDMVLMRDKRIVMCGSSYKEAEPFPVATKGWVARYV